MNSHLCWSILKEKDLILYVKMIHVQISTLNGSIQGFDADLRNDLKYSLIHPQSIVFLAANARLMRSDSALCEPLTLYFRKLCIGVADAHELPSYFLFEWVNKSNNLCVNYLCVLGTCWRSFVGFLIDSKYQRWCLQRTSACWLWAQLSKLAGRATYASGTQERFKEDYLFAPRMNHLGHSH